MKKRTRRTVSQGIREVLYSWREIRALAEFGSEPRTPLFVRLTFRPDQPTVIVNVEIDSTESGTQTNPLSGEIPTASLPALIDALTLAYERAILDGAIAKA